MHVIEAPNCEPNCVAAKNLSITLEALLTLATSKATPQERLEVSETFKQVVKYIQHILKHFHDRSAIDAVCEPIPIPMPLPIANPQTRSPTEDAEQDQAGVSESSQTSGLEENKSVSAPKFSEGRVVLTRDDMGEKMPETLHRLLQSPAFKNPAKLSFIGEETGKECIRQAMEREKHPDVRYNLITPRAEGGMKVTKSEPPSGDAAELPIVNLDSSLPYSPLDEAVASRKTRTVCHFAGIIDCNHPIYKNTPLHSGPLLAGMANVLTHANQTYTHFGDAGSATAMHKEDNRFLSCNIVLFGLKKWVIIRKEETEKFENWVSLYNKTCRYDQFVRHLNIFFNPEELQKAGIGYDIITQGPGELVVTQEYQYHQVFNITPTLAIATNFLPPGVQPRVKSEQERLKVCSLCGIGGLYGLEEFYVDWVDDTFRPDGSQKRKLMIGHGVARRRKKTQRWEPAVSARQTRQFTRRHKAEDRVTDDRGTVDRVVSRRLETVVNGTADDRGAVQEDGPANDVMRRAMKELERDGEFVLIPELPNNTNPGTRVNRLAMAVLSKHAIEQFITAIKVSKQKPEDFRRTPIASLQDGNNTEQQIIKLVAERVKLISGDENKGNYYTILTRHNLFQFAARYALLRGERQHIRKDVLDMVAEISGCTKSTIQKRAQIGDKWKMVCGRLTDGAGLLAFLPCRDSPFDVSQSFYLDLAKEKNREDLDMFYRLLDHQYVHELCMIANTWFDAVDGGKELADVEDIDVQVSDKDEIIRYLWRLVQTKDS
ncbi:uncharacterized protein Y057_8623 [Fusarium fujikuroi]|nr:uncharacterized protein Y057_8623 [Fusarium fujikuroi]SCN68852.1 uncharacterized protein FFC1_00166 [Fusarium fujikuroi]